MGYIMCRTQCLLAVVALCLGLAQSSSWDFAAVSSERIDYYSNGIVSHSEGISLKYINSIIYDGVSNKMFLVNFTSQILSYDVTARKFETLVRIIDYTNHNARSLGYDPVQQKLFWIDTISRTIKWVSLKPGAKNEDGGNTLASLDVDKPMSLAVDSCNGYIYWSSIIFDYKNNIFTYTIQRFPLNGGSSEVVVTDIKSPLENSLVVDQYTKKLYWIAREPYYEMYHVESADLDGRNKKTLFNGTNSEPNLLAVSEDSIYWVSLYHGIAQKLSKNPSTYETPQAISVGTNSRIVVNYKPGNEILNCERQNEQSTNNPATNVVPVCHNYCFNGDCTTSARGQPQCRCKPGFSGERCEVDLCRGYCLNGGRCSIDKNNKPVCQCNPSFSNEQCEIPNFLMKTFIAIRTLKDIISIDLPPLPSTCGNV